MLPEGIELLNKKKLSEQKAEEERRQQILEHELKEKQQIIDEEVNNIHASPLVSGKVSDVEYDEDYDRYNEIASYDLKTEIPTIENSTSKTNKSEPVKEEIREYAIDVWNGSPGLKAWGYNNSEK